MNRFSWSAYFLSVLLPAVALGAGAGEIVGAFADPLTLTDDSGAEIRVTKESLLGKGSVPILEKAANGRLRIEYQGNRYWIMPYEVRLKQRPIESHCDDVATGVRDDASGRGLGEGCP